MNALSAFAAAAVVMTLAGGLLSAEGLSLSRPALTRLFSVRAGILLAVAFTEILPEAWQTDRMAAGWGAVLAFVGLFVMANYAMTDTCPEYIEDCRVHYLGWAALFALCSHSFIDGFNLAAAFAAGARAGIAVGLALALHKVADGFTLATLFEQAGYAGRARFAAVLGVSLATPLGCALSGIGFARFPPSAASLALGFAGGSFVYIAAADIVPRLHRQRDPSGLLYLGLGLVGMAALRLL